MKIIDIAGGAYQPLTTPTGRLLWVDSEKGNDSLARRGFMTVPFATLEAAREAANAEDTIMVLPGLYMPTQQLAKHQVHWHFLPGSQVLPDIGGTTSLLRFSSMEPARPARAKAPMSLA